MPLLLKLTGRFKHGDEGALWFGEIASGVSENVSMDKNHLVTLNVTRGHDVKNGGSGGARTRNLCRDRAAL